MTTPDFYKIFGAKRPKSKSFDGYRTWRKDALAPEPHVPPPDAPIDLPPSDNVPKHPADFADHAPSPPSSASSLTSVAGKHLSDLASLLSEASKGEVTRADCLNWLLHTQSGRTLATRVATRHKRSPLQKETPMLDPIKKLEKMDVVQICKAISDEGNAYSISEHELVGLR
jgi:hypothetical protein